MKSPNAFRLAVLFTLVSLLSSRDVRQTTNVQVQKPEERELVTREMMEEYMKQNDDVAGPILDLALAGVGAAMTLSTIDYSKSGSEVALEVANAVVPVIGAALAFIPGVGPLISGLFLGVWGLISPLFAQKKDNPMEKMINDLAEKLRIEMDEKLSSIINRALHGEISRNNYICNKYNYIFQLMSNQLESNISLAVHDALELSGYLNDCDNFLKDTAEAFVYDEYADVLWVPSAITTSVRLSFLTEIIKYSHLMGIKRNVTAMYFQELQNDIKRQFKLHYTGYDKMRKELVAKHVNYQWYQDYLLNISQVEKSACQIQSQLLYFDRVVYPYGMPKVLNNTNLFAEIKMEYHYNPNDDGTVKHLQLFFNVDKSTFPGVLPSSNRKWYNQLQILNCIMGPMFPTLPTAFWFLFHAIPSKELSYEFRVMYFHTREYFYPNTQYPVPVLLADKKSDSKEYKEYADTYKKLNLGDPDKKGINLNIKFITPDDKLAQGSKKLIDMPIVARWKNCPYEYNRGGEATICSKGVKFYNAMFRMYSAGTYNVRRNEKINKLFRIGNPSLPFQGKYDQMEYGFLLGLEIIIRPSI